MTAPVVLVVEDEPSVRFVVAQALADEGYAVKGAADGADALACVEHDRPDCIVLDMRMPYMDGWAFARELRRRGIDVPIVVVAAGGDVQRWADEIKAARCLPKPFELDDVLAAVEQQLSDLR